MRRPSHQKLQNKTWYVCRLPSISSYVQLLDRVKIQAGLEGILVLAHIIIKWGLFQSSCRECFFMALTDSRYTHAGFNFIIVHVWQSSPKVTFCYWLRDKLEKWHFAKDKTGIKHTNGLIKYSFKPKVKFCQCCQILLFWWDKFWKQQMFADVCSESHSSNPYFDIKLFW